MKTGRACAVCGERNGTVTYGYRTVLRELGLPNWKDDKAHTACVDRLKTAAVAAYPASKKKKV